MKTIHTWCDICNDKIFFNKDYKLTIPSYEMGLFLETKNIDVCHSCCVNIFQAITKIEESVKKPKKPTKNNPKINKNITL